MITPNIVKLHMGKLIIIALLCATSPSTNADSKLENCHAIQDEPYSSLMQDCEKHGICKLVIPYWKTCKGRKRFLDKLHVNMSGQKRITADAVFQIAAPPLPGDRAFMLPSLTLRAIYLRQGGMVTKSGTDENGNSWVYEGPIINGKRHGVGIYAEKSKKLRLIRATFIMGIQKGKGESVMPGVRYVGDMHSYRANGDGISRYGGGDRYEGAHVDGKRQGLGAYKWKDGNKHLGNWVKGVREGQGIYTFGNGTNYIGDMQNNRFHGQGLMVWSNGSVYEGGFEGSRRQGKGSYVWPNGGRYEGDWVNGKRHGYGINIFAKGSKYSKYEGRWYDDTMSGSGVLYYRGGHRYEGALVSNKQHGRGIFTWADGSKYVGYYINGLRNGQGTYTWPGGNTYEGEWRNNERFNGKMKKANGEIISVYQDGKKTNDEDDSESD